MYSNKIDIPELTGDLSLEHLVPQTWEGYWALLDVDGAPLEDISLEDATERRRLRMHRFGNLTIVTAPLNSSMSNGPWMTKRRDLNHYSKLLLNARLADHEAWDEAAIDEHTAWLADRLLKIWPGPTPGSW